MRIRNDVVVSKNPRSKDKPWTVRWWGKYDVDKEAQPRFSKSFEIKKKAEQYAATLKRDISDGISTELQTITLEQLWEKFQKTAKMRVKNTSLSSYQITAKRLINYFGPNRNIKTIRREDAEEFISDVRLFKDNADPSDSSRDKEMRNAKLIFSKAVEWDYIRKNPFSKITLGKIKKNGWHFITFPEFKALLSAIENSRERDKHEKEDIERKYRLKAYYSVMYGCGLRFGEAIHLLWDNENIDFKNGQINLFNRNSNNGLPPFELKDYESRSIPCPEWVLKALKELKEHSSKHNPYVFLDDKRYELIKAKWEKWQTNGRADKWLNSTMLNNFNRQFRVYCSKAGIVTTDELSQHCLRKAYGTNLANLGTPVHTLKDLMGHSNIETTMAYYIKTTDANKKKAIKGLDGLMGE